MAVFPSPEDTVVPQEGRSCSSTRIRCIARRSAAPDVRPMRAWEFFDDPRTEADETLAAVRELGAGGDAITVDLGSGPLRISPSTPAG